MPRSFAVTAVVAVLALAFAPPALAQDDGPHCAVPGLKDVLVAGAGLYVGGEQDAAQLKTLHEKFAVKHVVDLRPADTQGAAPEAKLAKAAGQTYVRIAVKGAEDLTLENAKKLDAALAATKGEAVLVHCTTGNRAAALLALRDALVRKVPADEALSFMRRSGLTKLETAVTAQLH